MEKRRNSSSGVKLHIHLWNVVVRFIFSLILQIWYVEVRISWSISESPLDLEITRVDCNLILITITLTKRLKTVYLKKLQLNKANATNTGTLFVVSFEPEHNNKTIIPVWPTKVRLHILPVWLKFSPFSPWIAWKLWKAYAISEDWSAWMHRLIWVFAGRTSLIL